MAKKVASCDNFEEVIREIRAIDDAFNSLREIISVGERNDLEHLLSIPELSETEDLNEQTINFIEELVYNIDEQKIVDENNDSVFRIEDVGSTEIVRGDEISMGIETIGNTEDESRTLMTESSHTTSFVQSGISFFSSFFNLSKKDTTSSSTSSVSTSRAYISRWLNRKKTETLPPGSEISIPSCNSQNDQSNIDPQDLDEAERIIEDTEAQGPTGTPHLSSIARVVQRPILAFSSSMTLRHRAGKNYSGEPIRLQFHSPRSAQTGHWTGMGNTEPVEVSMDLNNCLFNVICAQTGQKPSELRRKTIEEMRKHVPSLARRIRAIKERENCDGITILLIGGASYNGSSPSDCKRVIDNSQQGRCHPGHLQGHPRGHASYPEATGPTDSAENYSRNGWKTGFLSRADQDVVGHTALMTPQAQQAMNALNNGSESQAVHLHPSQLGTPLPNCAEFNNGVMSHPIPIKSLVLVLRHHAGHANEPDYPVFVHTFYPKN